MGAPFASDAPEGLVSSGAFALCGARREEGLRRCPSQRLSGTAFVGKGGRLRNRFGGRGIAADACGTYGTAAGTAYQRKSPRTRAGLRVSSSSTKPAMWSPQAGAGLRIVRNVLWSASFGGLPSHDALPIMHGESGERGFDAVNVLRVGRGRTPFAESVLPRFSFCPIRSAIPTTPCRGYAPGNPAEAGPRRGGRAAPSEG